MGLSPNEPGTVRLCLSAACLNLCLRFLHITICPHVERWLPPWLGGSTGSKETGKSRPMPGVFLKHEARSLEEARQSWRENDECFLLESVSHGDGSISAVVAYPILLPQCIVLKCCTSLCYPFPLSCLSVLFIPAVLVTLGFLFYTSCNALSF